MFKKLSKYGNSMALIIDKPILELLNIDKETQLKITTDGENIIIVPINTKSKMSKKLKKSTEKILKEYAEAFKKLAE